MAKCFAGVSRPPTLLGDSVTGVCSQPSEKLTFKTTVCTDLIELLWMPSERTGEVHPCGVPSRKWPLFLSHGQEAEVSIERSCQKDDEGLLSNTPTSFGNLCFQAARSYAAETDASDEDTSSADEALQRFPVTHANHVGPSS